MPPLIGDSIHAPQEEGAPAPTLWRCGHTRHSHTREEAAACWSSQQKDHNEPTPTTAAAICSTAACLVGGDRAVTHGDKSINFSNTASVWNALLECKARRLGWPLYDVLPKLDALDVANFLEAFKISRRYSGSHNLDDYIDGAGYAGCAGEIAEKLK